jgi:hypothetical protein
VGYDLPPTPTPPETQDGEQVNSIVLLNTFHFTLACLLQPPAVSERVEYSPQGPWPLRTSATATREARVPDNARGPAAIQLDSGKRPAQVPNFHSQRSQVSFHAQFEGPAVSPFSSPVMKRVRGEATPRPSPALGRLLEEESPSEALLRSSPEMPSPRVINLTFYCNIPKFPTLSAEFP